ERIKFRVRWYGDNKDQSAKRAEIKQKLEFLNKKEIIKLNHRVFPGLNKVKTFGNDILSEIKSKNEILYLKYKMYQLHPTLINWYDRSYFFNSQSNTRITIDSDTTYQSVSTKISSKEILNIVEIKYDKKDIFIHELPFLKFTRYSKYVKGILLTSNYKSIY
ncbi:VTC domain-containing protein, partial [Candidatus Marinimicrobia bacterium]|nr:VTC domain-containing protein [Candidatus Neomarinimicrobiota bacterium]